MASRTGLWLLFPLVLLVTGFLRDEERRAIAANLSPAAIREAISRYGESSEAEKSLPEALRAEQRDEDARGP